MTNMLWLLPILWALFILAWYIGAPITLAGTILIPIVIGIMGMGLVLVVACICAISFDIFSRY